jgi:hypothetical protein
MDSLGAVSLENSVVEIPPAPARDESAAWQFQAFRIVVWLLIAVVFAITFRLGWTIRRTIFDIFEPIRFISDDSRGCYWGLVASGPEGYLNQYDKMEPQLPERLDQRWDPWLDYAPLRLLVMRHWGFYIRKYFPPDPSDSLLNAYRTSFAYMAPPLYFNAGMEVFGSVCAFLLTRHWVLRANAGAPRYAFEGVWQGAGAAVILWLSPDMMLSSHAWVTWDTWIVPWFLCAALLASLDWWFAAGLALGIGTMFKAQQLCVAPIFVLWPLTQGKFGAIGRWAVGLVFAIAIIGSPWCLTYLPSDKLQAARDVQSTLSVPQYPPDLFQIPRRLDRVAAIWIVEIVLLVAAIPWVLHTLAPESSVRQRTRLGTFLYSREMWFVAAALLIFAATCWPFFLKSNRQFWWLGILSGAILSACVLFVSFRNLPFVLAGAVACGLLLCLLLFDGSDGWLKCTFAYGLDHWPYMIQGLTSNIPAVFEQRFGWSHEAQDTAFTLTAIPRRWPSFLTAHQLWPAVDWDISAKTLFDSIFVFLLILSGISVGLQARRNDRRMLAALVTPWLLFFLIPVQIHERYLVFGAGAAVCAIGADIGAFFLWLFLSACSSIMLVDVLFHGQPGGIDQVGQNLDTLAPRIFSADSGQTISQYVAATHPDIAWGLVVIALVYLYLSFTPTRRTENSGRKR